ncbi:MAG: putative lipid II flippase FtsW [Oscillospiraceae bacterium]|jgi:cell division protein FtsW|nr:putative lipid II flippase FtsW [Oscillospiraceae bacterium]
MTNDRHSSNAARDNAISEINAARTGAYARGAPMWEKRELSSEHLEERQKKSGVDVPFMVLTLIILMLGVIMVLSASFARAFYTSGQPMQIFMRQLVFAVSGVAIMLVVSRISVRTLSRWSLYLAIVSIALLVLVLVIGVKVNGARRWIGVGSGNSSFTFQPSEIVKLALIMSFAQMSCKFGKKMRTFKYGVMPFMGMTAVIVILLGREPHISASVIIVALAVIMMFAGGVRLKWFVLAGLVIALLAGALYVTYIRPSSKEKTDLNADLQQAVSDNSGRLGYAGGRISAWLDPESDPLGSGLQIRQSLFAVGSGGVFGQGLGQSRQKYLYLPEEHNDYIFAIVCEELGFIGAMLILVLFVLLIIRGYWLALHARDKYGSLITIGITSLLAIQVFLNVAVVTNLLPATGISLPFFSYGGTALWIQLLQIGIILSVSREIPVKG